MVEAAVATGVPAPAVRRTRAGAVLSGAGALTVRVLQWEDLEPADPGLDPALVARLLVALGTLVQPPADLWVCHRDVFADNVRRRGGGGLCVFDVDNAGPQDPAHEPAFAMLEFATDARGAVQPERARTLLEAYSAAGGPGRLRGPGSFSMAIAVLRHPGQHAATSWLAASNDLSRAVVAVWSN